MLSKLMVEDENIIFKSTPKKYKILSSISNVLAINPVMLSLYLVNATSAPTPSIPFSKNFPTPPKLEVILFTLVPIAENTCLIFPGSPSFSLPFSCFASSIKFSGGGGGGGATLVAKTCNIELSKPVFVVI